MFARVVAVGVLLGAACLVAVQAGNARTQSSSAVSLIVEPGSGSSPVISLIRSARHSIRLEVYILSNSSVIQALGQARARGVDVRVLLEERPFGARQYASFAYSLLRQYHVSVRWANENAFTFTHEKAMVVDSKAAGIFSFNLSSSAFDSNREFGIIDRNAADARTIAAIFNADWSRRAAHFKSSRLVVSPVNSRPDFNRLIGSARKTLDVYAEEVADSGIERALAQAHRRGVRVRVLISSPSSGVTTLRASGVGVTIMPSPYVHAKAFVADGRTLFVGSENISATSLDNNREMGIILNNPSIASRIESTFSGDWRSNSAPAVGPVPTVKPGSKFSVRVTASPPSLSRGQELSITGTTSSGAACKVRVTYPDGYVSRARALAVTRIANGFGQASWSWHVGSSVKGTSQAAVTCTLGGRSATGSTTFQIV